MNVLITGGAGFIGSHLADALIDKGFDVTIIDNMTCGKEENIPRKSHFFRVDIRDKHLSEVFKAKNFDVVFHLAGQIAITKSIADPVNDAQVNVGGTINLLEQCRHFDVKKFIFASTGGAIYGEQQYFPADENHPNLPVSPYGIAKLAIEKYMYWYHYDFKMDCTALRYANVYGPRQNPFSEAGVISIFSNKILNNVQPVINGTGKQTRDFVFIDDVVEANFKALKMSGYNIFNIGTGIETEINTLFDHINAFFGSKFPRAHAPHMTGGQSRSVLDYSKAKKLLGWEPAVKLDKGIIKTAEFFKRRWHKQNAS